MRVSLSRAFTRTTPTDLYLLTKRNKRRFLNENIMAMIKLRVRIIRDLNKRRAILCFDGFELTMLSSIDNGHKLVW